MNVVGTLVVSHEYVLVATARSEREPSSEVLVGPGEVCAIHR